MSTPLKLFQSLQIGDITLQHRIVLAPLARYRADDVHVYQDIATEYYRQRSQVPGTLPITEATSIAAEADGYANVPGIWSDEQIAVWKKVTDAVHANGSYMFLQLWAAGRAAEPDIIHGEDFPYVSSSSTMLEERSETPQELSKDDIKRYIGLYVQAAKMLYTRLDSIDGYLPEQFLQDTCNKRTDEYGGSVENRGHFVLEVVDAVVEAVGVKKTAIRFSPWSRFLCMCMKDPVPTFAYVLEEITKRHPELAYVHSVEPRISRDSDTDPIHISHSKPVVRESNDFARGIWGSRPFISAGGFKLDTATTLIEEHKSTAVAFGRLFLANPDLPERLLAGKSLTKCDRSTFHFPELREHLYHKS